MQHPVISSDPEKSQYPAISNPTRVVEENSGGIEPHCSLGKAIRIAASDDLFNDHRGCKLKDFIRWDQQGQLQHLVIPLKNTKALEEKVGYTEAFKVEQGDI